MLPDLLVRKQSGFVLWRPGSTATTPKVVIGTFAAGAPPTLANPKTLAMKAVAGIPDLYQLAVADCGLTEGVVYHYWFEITDTDAYGAAADPVRVTDPTALSVDWRLTTVLPPPHKPEPNDGPTSNEVAAAVVKVSGGKLVPCDADGGVGNTFAATADVDTSKLPVNQALVIYELPTTWTKAGDLVDQKNVGVGTFQDVRALLDTAAPGANFAAVPAVGKKQHITDLGVNALELLPPADTYHDRTSWGYATSNYFAPDFDLGKPLTAAFSTALTDLLALVRACHAHGIRFFYDAVMAFGRHDPYDCANYLDFHVKFLSPCAPDQSQKDPEQGDRNGFGGDLWKYAYQVSAYDPLGGATQPLYPARRHMLAHLLHWMAFFHVDGLRLDSVNNYGNWDFACQVSKTTRTAWRDRWTAEHGTVEGADERFLVVGEELSEPKALLGRIDSLWNEDFKRMVRKVILGRNADGEPSFEWSVRKVIDCRNLQFGTGYQAVNYLGSHDVGGPDNQRLFDYLAVNGVAFKAQQTKLAFVCLLTAVGIPMILAGDEFGQNQGVAVLSDANKQSSPIDFGLTGDPWRADLLSYVSRLVKFRTTSSALGFDDTSFIHVDFEEGKRVLVWQRGRPGVDAPVVVVANFSDWGTPDPTNPASRYHVPNWPALPPGKSWREISQGRPVPQAWAGEEPLYPWEAKVYAAL